MRRAAIPFLLAGVVWICESAVSRPEAFVNGLRSLGCSLVPAARKVQSRDVAVDAGWGIDAAVPPCDSDSGAPAVRRQ